MTNIGSKRSKRTKGSNGPESRLPTIGTVTKVFTRRETDDSGPDAFSNHEANVQLHTGAEEPRRIPVHQDFPGTAGVPKKGDFVRIAYLQGRTESGVIVGYAYNVDENRPPVAEPGHWRRKFDTGGDEHIYVEAERTDHGEIDPGNDDYDVYRIAKKEDGLSDPTTQIALDNSGSSPHVRIETDGDITISAGGDVLIDEGGTATPVLTENAVFEYEDTGDTGDGSASPTTKTTSTVSNGEVTETEIE